MFRRDPPQNGIITGYRKVVADDGRTATFVIAPYPRQAKPR
jgi:hypothetical protein